MTEQTDPAPALRRLADEYEVHAAALLAVADDLTDAHPVTRAALRHAADILSAVELGFRECATDGTHAPMEDLAGRTNGWLCEIVVEPTGGAHAVCDLDPTADPYLVLADDGNPHIPDEE